VPAFYVHCPLCMPPRLSPSTGLAVSNRNYRLDSALRPLAFQLWLAKQIRSRTTLRLWHVMQILSGERELRVGHALTEPSDASLDIWANEGLSSIATFRLQEEPSLSGRNPNCLDFCRSMFRSMCASVRFRRLTVCCGLAINIQRCLAEPASVRPFRTVGR
jgi:hypothetical protein